MIIRSLIVLCLLWALFSCNKQVIEEIDIDNGFEYFPLEIGQTKVYQLDSIIFDPIVGGISVDTFSWLLREEIVDTLRDGTGELVYIVERSQKLADSLDWKIESVWTASRTSSRAISTEDNLRFVKMIFPLREDASWDGNVFVDQNLNVIIAGETLEIFKGWDSKILTLSENFNVNGQNYDNVLSIQLADNENLIEYRFGVEKYAKNIGLIYKELWVVDTQCQFCCNSDFAFCETLDWIEKGEAGFVLRQQLIN